VPDGVPLVDHAEINGFILEERIFGFRLLFQSSCVFVVAEVLRRSRALVAVLFEVGVPRLFSLHGLGINLFRLQQYVTERKTFT